MSKLVVGDTVEKLNGKGAGDICKVLEVKADGKLKCKCIETGQVHRTQQATNYELLKIIPPSPAEEAQTSDHDSEGSGLSDWSDVSVPSRVASVSNQTLPQYTLEEKHSLRFGAFNGKQLSFFDPSKLEVHTNNESCKPDSEMSVLYTFAEFVRIDWNLDVLMISEIPCNVGLQRVQMLLDELNNQTYQSDRHSAYGWVMYHSEVPAKNDNSRARREYHVAIVKDSQSEKGLEVIDTMTHHKRYDGKGEQFDMDYPPFTIFLRDDRFQEEACKRIALTSVHLPPEARARDRNVQGKGFLNSYMYQREWPDQFKKDRPFTFNKFSKPFCTHIIGGDFNCVPTKELEVSPNHWWQAFGSHIATSSGGKPLDNWLVNQSAVEKVWLDVRKNVGYLSHHGPYSDHDVIQLELIERVKPK